MSMYQLEYEDVKEIKNMTQKTLMATRKSLVFNKTKSLYMVINDAEELVYSVTYPLSYNGYEKRTFTNFTDAVDFFNEV